MKRLATIGLAAVALVCAACAHAGARDAQWGGGPDLAGAWRSSVQFKTGAFAGITDLEFMQVFNTGGTMTESSNYDAAPPVPPAYGVWRRTGPSTFEARYEFYVARPPAKAEELLDGGWQPAGRGVLVERITLAADGKTYTSAIQFDTFDAAGRRVEGGGLADARAQRLGF
jgi:hypothetical protein